MTNAPAVLAVSWLDHGLWRQHVLEVVLEASITRVLPARRVPAGSTWIGWGYKRSGLRARRLAARDGLNCLLLEDGFLRSFGLGVTGAAPLSFVVDDVGMYYDATRPSRLENLLNAGNFSADLLADARRALNILQRDGLSKYNQAPDVPERWFDTHSTLVSTQRQRLMETEIRSEQSTRQNRSAEYRVLVVDQTAGDVSIRYGLGKPAMFDDMLIAAIRENPGAQIWVKTHPDVLASRKQGCFHRARDHADVRWIGQDYHPHSLLRFFDRVYVVTSQLGLDALLLGKKVTCFGMPFYAGWGLTDDRQTCTRRAAKRSLVELVAAAYLQYARYINPETGERGTFFDVATHVARQKQMVRFWARPSVVAPKKGCADKNWSGRVFCFGFSSWKHAHVRPFFGDGVQLIFTHSVSQARARGISRSDRMAVWGQKDAPELRNLADELGLDLVRIEDGFVRSVGLGADFVPPMSLVFDRRGIYFDPTCESDLEHLLNHAEFTPELLARARNVRERICRDRISKYNIERNEKLAVMARGRRILLVPGQVEDDASILKAAGEVRSNEGLLRAARAAHPDAFIIYKPHPDVLARNRQGEVDHAQVSELCDHIETQVNVIRCIEAAHDVHTMTSLTGFDALLRGKHVIAYGAPFYAGWGLTEDRAVLPRRHRRLSLDELVAGVLLLYPRYWDARTAGFVACETVLDRIVEARERSAQVAFLGKYRKIRKWSSYLNGIVNDWWIRRSVG